MLRITRLKQAFLLLVHNRFLYASSAPEDTSVIKNSQIFRTSPTPNLTNTNQSLVQTIFNRHTHLAHPPPLPSSSSHHTHHTTTTQQTTTTHSPPLLPLLVLLTETFLLQSKMCACCLPWKWQPIARLVAQSDQILVVSHNEHNRKRQEVRVLFVVCCELYVMCSMSYVLSCEFHV